MSTKNSTTKKNTVLTSSSKGIGDSAKGKTSNDSGSDSKKRKRPEGSGGGAGLEEIDSLFSAKKEQDKKALAEIIERRRLKNKKRNDSCNNNNKPESYSGTTSRGVHNGNNSILSKGDWVDDGLGGKYNHEGYTGRVEDGVKVFKAHVLNRPGSGQTKDCPFDCDCCFI